MIGKWLLDTLNDAAVAAVLVLALGWLFRKWISTRLTERLRLETEQELKKIQSRLDAAEAKVSAVRQAGIDAILQVNTVVVAERITAIKQLWNGVIKWKAATVISTIVSAMDIDYIRKNADHLGTRNTMKQLLESLHYMDLMEAMSALQQHRPFVTERAWGLFAAYHGFYVGRIMRAVSLSLGNKDLAIRLWQTDSELQVVSATAPADMVEAYKVNAIGQTASFLSYVEQELLLELKKSLTGEQSGSEASRQAASIVSTVDAVLLEAKKEQAA